VACGVVERLDIIMVGPFRDFRLRTSVTDLTLRFQLARKY